MMIDLPETIKLPHDMHMAFASGRPELMQICKPRAISKKESAHWINAMRVLLAKVVEQKQVLDSRERLISQAAMLASDLRGLAHRLEDRINGREEAFDEEDQ